MCRLVLLLFSSETVKFVLRPDFEDKVKEGGSSGLVSGGLLLNLSSVTFCFPEPSCFSFLSLSFINIK